MKKFILAVIAVLSSAFLFAQNRIFVYSPGPGDGLHLAHYHNYTWVDLGQLCSSDYSAWGAEKKMHSPHVLRAADGTWRLVFQVNSYAPAFAAAYSTNLVDWRPQEYPRMSIQGCLSPVTVQTASGFDVVFRTSSGLRVTHADAEFRHFSADAPYSAAAPQVESVTVAIGGKDFSGQEFRIEDDLYNEILAFMEAKETDDFISSERMYNDIPVFGLNIYPEKRKAISDKLIGVFFEDISYAADGGLYAELVQNRDFEYNGEKKGWNATTAWSSDAEIAVSTDDPLSPMNPHHIILGNASVRNGGWDGIALKAGEKYDFSISARCIGVGSKGLKVYLQTAAGTVSSVASVRVSGSGWARYTATISASADCNDAELVIAPQGKGSAAVDMVSLFPRDTYKGHGLRRDIAETIAALNPKFVRFPGGCLAHGQGLDNMYHWNTSIGEWQDRKPELNIWNYHQTKGLGFYEFFQWCEDMGAEPLPVLPAGVPCQNSHADEHGYGGQQGGIPMEDMPAYCEEICNLIEWANGDPAVSKWARMRADAGHPAPFNLKYLGIGNEDLITTVFEERMLMIAKAVKARFPEIVICGTAGPFHSPSADYQEGWSFAHANKDVIELVDEHYYESTGWFMNHRDYYDLYDRQGPKVYLGEYAARADTRASSLESALAEALYLTDIERNGDVVAMTSYAPLLCNMKHHNWDPDMIYFDNSNVYVTPSYETQRIFGNYSGDQYIESRLDGPQEVLHRLGVSVVADSSTGSTFIKIVNANAFPVKINMPADILDAAEKMAKENAAGSESAGQDAIAGHRPGKNNLSGSGVKDPVYVGIDGFCSFDGDPAEETVKHLTAGLKRVGPDTVLVPAYSVNVIAHR